MNKEMILNLLRQYGFGLNQKDPYLYDGELGLGIVYSFKDPFYGMLTRVYQAFSLKEYEDFLNKYSWYKKNGQKTRVKICLENYKEIMANPKFIYQGKEKNYQELQDIAQNKKETVLKEKNYIKKLRRTVNILMQILDIKRKLQIETRKNYEEFYQNYITKKEAFEKELANYLKEKQEEKETSLPPFIEDLKDVEINKLRLELEKDLTKEELEQQIYNLTDFIKELEVDEEYLKNKYQLICLPLQIKEIKEKEQVLESYKKKISLFNKREKLLKELQDIEEKSTLKSIVTYKHYKENEEKRIIEKYAMIPDLDMRTIGDFLAEFDNIKFEEMTYTSEEKEEYKSITAIIETFINKENSSKIIDELIANSPEDEYLRFAILSFFQNNETDISNEEEIKIISSNINETIKLNGMTVKTYVVNNKELDTIKFETNSNDIIVRYYYQTLLENIESENISEDMSIKIIGNLKKNSTIYLQINCNDTEAKELRIALPNSLRLANTENLKGYWIMNNAIDYISVYKQKGYSSIKIPLIVTLDGNYKFENIVNNQNGIYHISNSLDLDIK